MSYGHSRQWQFKRVGRESGRKDYRNAYASYEWGSEQLRVSSGRLTPEAIYENALNICAIINQIEKGVGETPERM